MRYDITNVTPGIMILPDTPIMHQIKLIQLSTEFKKIKEFLSINMLPITTKKVCLNLKKKKQLR